MFSHETRKNWSISFEELSLRARKILAQQSGTTYAQALAQVERLRKTSKVRQSLKKSRFNS